MYTHDSFVKRGYDNFVNVIWLHRYLLRVIGASHVIWAAPLLALPAAGKFALFVVIKNLISIFLFKKNGKKEK
jgi:hypothetical protein